MRVGIAALLFLLCSVARPNDIQEESGPWASASFSQSYLAKFIDNQKCYSSAQYLLSCVNAVNAAGALLNPPRQIPAPEVMHLASGRTPSAESTWRRIYIEKRWRALQIREFAAFHYEAAATVPELRFNFEHEIELLISGAPKGIPPQMIRAYALNGHLQIFDSHAYVVPTLLLQQRRKRDQKLYVGAGFNLDFLNQAVLVHEVFPDSPAAHAGLLPDDRLRAIAPTAAETPVPVEGKGPDEVYDLLTGDEGIPLALSLEREGRPLTLTLIRGPVHIQTTSGRLVGPRHDVGYVQLRSFESLEICDAVKAKVLALAVAGAKSLLLDLRGNGGGEKSMAVCVTSLFVGPDKPILGTRALALNIPSLIHLFPDQPGPWNKTVWESGTAPQITSLPLIVLLNALSASASELVAGALQEHRRAWLVGEQSAGKGSIQMVRAPPDNPSVSIAHTVAHFYAANLRPVQISGIAPNFTVPLRRGAEPEDRFYPREADIYPFAAAEVSDPWLDPRTAQVQTIQNCVESKWRDEPETRDYRLDGRADYQVAYALAILKCL